jgi:hypothetical protein
MFACAKQQFFNTQSLLFAMLSKGFGGSSMLGLEGRACQRSSSGAR